MFKRRMPRPNRKFAALLVLAGFSTLVLYLSFLSPNAPLKFERKYTGEIPVVVVEEHHEVLPHWYAAANSGILSKSGNVLVHIDGHSDFAMTDIVKGYPLFRWPKTDYEISTLMQTNDAFIMSATGTGMFNKLIWVWPKWDSVNHNTTAAEITYSIGWYHKKDDNGHKTNVKAFCQCMTITAESQYFDTQAEEGEEGKICLSFERERFSLDGSYDGDQIAESECNVGKKALGIEVLETAFLDHIKDGLTDGGRVILDIDEDYFGCESGVEVLTNSGIQWSVLEEINEYLMLAICPKTTEDEKVGDRLMTEVVKFIVKLCKSGSECDIKKAIRLSGLLINKRRSEGKLKLFCRSPKMTFRLVRLIAKRLVRMTKEQLKVLIDVGFCSRTTPKTYKGNAEEGFFDNSGFQICHGVNTPNETIVITHSPDEVEFNMRMALLDKIVQHDDMPVPRVVTICRSMRDGYTPKKFFHKIEAGVIDIVKRKLEGYNYKLKYDIDLLGGALGWPGRHDEWVNKL